MQNGKWGFIDKSGTVKSKPTFDAVMLASSDCPIADFSEGLSVARKGSTYGYIDESGEFVIPAIFDYASSFSEGLALVSAGGKSGFIDKTVVFIFKPDYESYAPSIGEIGPEHISNGINFGYQRVGFADGVAPVEASSRKVFYIDKEGAKSIGPWEYGETFSEGYALVGNDLFNLFYIDRTGQKLRNSDVYPDGFNNWFSEGLAVVGPKERRGYIDTSGTQVIQLQFQEADMFQEGLACVGVGTYPNNKFGFIDKSGKFVVPPVLQGCGTYGRLGGFSNGIALVRGSDRELFYIDRTGAKLFSPMGQNACQFIDGLAASTESGKVGYLDIKGKIVWPLQK